MGCIARVALLVALVGCFGDPLTPQTPQSLTSPGPLFAGHAALDCTSCHVDATAEVNSNKCLSCHTVLASRVFQGKGLHASAVVRGKRCESCHGDHRGAGYDPMGWRSMRGGRDGFDHDLTGWPLDGDHGTTACNNCHFTRDRQGLQVYVGVATACGSCHGHPHRFTKRPLEACERCHSAEAWQPLVDLRFDHNDRRDARMPLFGVHEAVPCRDCHAGAVFGFGLTRPERCEVCHMSPHAGHVFGKPDCTWCHSPMTKTFRSSIFDHSERTRFDLAGHRRLTCATCHPASAGTTVPPRGCESCHADRNPHGARFAAFPACDTCHKASLSSQPIKWQLGHFLHGKLTRFSLTGKHADLTCRACHRGSGPTSFEKLDFAKGCIGCHTHAKVHDNKYTNAQCTLCHVAPGSIQARSPPASP